MGCGNHVVVKFTRQAVGVVLTGSDLVRQGSDLWIRRFDEALRFGIKFLD
jgi:hypothetical protein